MEKGGIAASFLLFKCFLPGGLIGHIVGTIGSNMDITVSAVTQKGGAHIGKALGDPALDVLKTGGNCDP